MKPLYRYLLFLLFVTNLYSAKSQCSWTQIYQESYEYTTAIPDLIPGTTYQTTPQTFVGCVRTGTYGMYMNIVNGFTGLLYSKTFNTICVGQEYRFSFSTRDAFNSVNDLTIEVKDGLGNVIVSQNVINGNTWNDITMTAFTAPTSTLVFEISTNTAGTGGNDVGFDDLTLLQCQPNPYIFPVTECASIGSMNLFSELSGTPLTTSGVWTGPTALTNGHQGTFTASTNTNGTYQYTTNFGPGCADSFAILNVTFVQSPDINTIQNITACGPYVLPPISGIGLSGNQSYYTNTNGTGTPILPGATITTSQTIYAYDGAPGCSDEVTFSLTFIQPPVITVSGNDTICEGDDAVFNVNSASPNMTYNWTPGNLSGANISVTPLTSTVYSVSGTNEFGCVSNFVSTVAIVKPTPALTIVASGDTICEGEQISLQVTSSINGTNFIWDDASTSLNRNDAPTENTTYTVQGTSSNGCTNQTSHNVHVIPTLDVNITGSLAFCEEGSTVLTANGNNPDLAFTWVHNNSTNTTVTIDSTNVGWIYLHGDYYNCPTGIDSVNTSLKPNPIVAVPVDFQICPGESIVATVSADLPNSTFIWFPDNLTGESNKLSPAYSTYYSVYAENDGCISEEDSFYVDILPNCAIEVPNVFSPNGDFVNDYFSLISYEGIATLEIQIVNRWGNLLYSDNQLQFQWDGTSLSGDQVSDGVYFYRLVYSLTSGDEFQKQGFVHLVR